MEKYALFVEKNASREKYCVQRILGTKVSIQQILRTKVSPKYYYAPSSAYSLQWGEGQPLLVTESSCNGPEGEKGNIGEPTTLLLLNLRIRKTRRAG